MVRVSTCLPRRLTRLETVCWRHPVVPLSPLVSPPFFNLLPAPSPNLPHIGRLLSRGGRGVYIVKDLPDVGIMQQLKIGHDNSGPSPGACVGPASTGPVVSA